MRSISRNSPCLGDAASYLTGTRVRFGTQDVSGLKEGDYGAGTGLQASAARIAQTTSGASGALMDVYLPLR